MAITTPARPPRTATPIAGRPPSSTRCWSFSLTTKSGNLAKRKRDAPRRGGHRVSADASDNPQRQRYGPNWQPVRLLNFARYTNNQRSHQQQTTNLTKCQLSANGERGAPIPLLARLLAKSDRAPINRRARAESRSWPELRRSQDKQSRLRQRHIQPPARARAWSPDQDRPLRAPRPTRDPSVLHDHSYGNGAAPSTVAGAATTTAG
jgi:hypothetical protein